MTRTDARGCRPIIPDPSPPGPTCPRHQPLLRPEAARDGVRRCGHIGACSSFEHAVTSAIAECRGDLRVYAMACRTARPWPADWRASAPSGSPPSPRWPGRRRSRWPPGAGRASRCRSSRSTGRPTGPRRTARAPARGPGPRLMIRRPAGPAIGVDEWARLWVRANEAEPEPRVERLPLDTIVRRWRGPSPGPDVDFYAVHGAATRGRAAVSRCRARSSVARATPSTPLFWQFLHSHARDP